MATLTPTEPLEVRWLADLFSFSEFDGSLAKPSDRQKFLDKVSAKQLQFSDHNFFHVSPCNCRVAEAPKTKKVAFTR